MKNQKLIIFLIGLVIVLAVVLWILAAKFISSRKLTPPLGMSVSVDTNARAVSTLASKVEQMLEPASARSAEERSSASAEFGAALERAGITTQTGPSH